MCLTNYPRMVILTFSSKLILRNEKIEKDNMMIFMILVALLTCKIG